MYDDAERSKKEQDRGLARSSIQTSNDSLRGGFFVTCCSINLTSQQPWCCASAQAVCLNCVIDVIVFNA
jgi:hypothetical protein